MSTIHRFDGLRVVIYPNDHRPVHVHIIGGGREAVFKLHCPKGPPELRENHGFSGNDLGKILAELAGNLGGMCKEWRAIHGKY